MSHPSRRGWARRAPVAARRGGGAHRRPLGRFSGAGAGGHRDAAQTSLLKPHCTREGARREPRWLRHDGLNTKLPALKHAESLRETFAELAGLSHRAAAKALNERGIKTATGKDWTAVQVTRVRERLGLA